MVTEKGENTQADTQRPQSRQWPGDPQGSSPPLGGTDPLLKRTLAFEMRSLSESLFSTVFEVCTH